MNGTRIVREVSHSIVSARDATPHRLGQGRLAMAIVAANDGFSPPDGDFFADSWESPKQRWWNLDGVALQGRVFSNFVGTDNVWVPLVVLAKNGERVWTCSRHPLNQRGDMASVASRKASVETVGIIQGLRGGAWLLPRDDVLQDPAWGSFIQHYHVLHWATLIEGAKLAWEEDTTKTNAVVQLSVTSGLTGCKIFMKKTPAYIIKYLVDLGNSMNSENSATTFLDVIRSIEGVEAAWAKKKDAMQWTIASEGAVDVRASEAHLRKRPPQGPLEELPVFGDDCQHLESESQQREDDRCHDDLLGCLRGLLPARCRFHQRTYQPTRRDHSERLLHAQTLERQAHWLCDDGASLGVALAGAGDEYRGFPSFCPQAWTRAASEFFRIREGGVACQ